jgi:hypothetical protein
MSIVLEKNLRKSLIFLKKYVTIFKDVWENEIEILKAA